MRVDASAPWWYETWEGNETAIESYGIGEEIAASRRARDRELEDGAGIAVSDFVFLCVLVKGSGVRLVTPGVEPNTRPV